MILQLANNIESDLVEYNTENSSDLKFVVRGETIETIKNSLLFQLFLHVLQTLNHLSFQYYTQLSLIQYYLLIVISLLISFT